MARKRNLVSAVAYMRTSSATNVGADKDSDRRQRRAIERFARQAGYVVAADDWFYDAAVRGDKVAIQDRPGFGAMLHRIAANGVRTVLVEDATRFARSVAIQEFGIELLLDLGVTVVTADAIDLTELSPEKVAMRQMRGVFSQLEKAKLVLKLRVARERIRDAKGKCEGRKSYQEAVPATVALAKELAAAGMSYRKISARLAELGHKTSNGRRHVASAIQKMVRS